MFLHHAGIADADFFFFSFFQVKGMKKKNCAECSEYCISQCHRFLLRDTEDRTKKKYKLILILALHCIFFSFLCKSLSKTNMSSLWKNVIMNLQEKCIFSCGKRKVAKALKISVLYENICPSNTMHIKDVLEF